MRLRRVITCLIACLALLAAGVPIAVGSPGGEVIQPSSIEPLLNYYDIDQYEEGGGDDIKADARIISSIPGPGTEPYKESHTLDAATGTTGDQDWFRFTVTSDDVMHKYAFLIEAATYDNSTRTTVEVYGPGLMFTPDMSPLDGVDPAAIAASEGGTFMFPGTGGSSVPFLPYKHGGAGTYFFRVRPWSNGGSYGGSSGGCAGPYTLRIKRGNLLRVSGADRIATAIAISKESMRTEAQASQNDHAVVLANAYDFPDALAGSVLCGLGDGPLLLTPRDHLPDSVRDEIARTGAKRVYVVGGEQVVGPAVVSALQAMSPAPTVIRVKGDDRYMTASEIALQAESDVAGYFENFPPAAIIASGEDFPDALAASAVSAFNNVPILLTTKNALHPDAEEALFHLGVQEVIVVGGPAAISNAVTDRLATVLGGTSHVYRVWGDTRYETAKEFAVWACDIEGPGPDGDTWIGTPGNTTILGQLYPMSVGIASGENFPDALAGGAFCGNNWHPILLNPSRRVSDYIFEEHEGKLPGTDTDYFSDTGGGPLLTSRLLGGSVAVSDSVFLELDQFFGFESP